MSRPSGLTLKLEGAAKVGYRALLIAGAADPRFIARHEEIFAAVARIVRDLVCEDTVEDYRLGFRLYGVDGVRRWAEPPAQMPREAFVMGECIAALARAGGGGDPHDQAVSAASWL